MIQKRIENRLCTDLQLLRDAFLSRTARRMEKSSLETIRRALRVAEQAHAGQTRDDGTPYMLHPLRIALCLMDELNQYDAGLLCVALLHDAIEDQGQMSARFIAAEFGKAVVSDVLTLTKPDRCGRTREEVNRIYFKRLRGANQRCRLIKLADKLDNVRDAGNSPDLAKRQRTISETRSFYIGVLLETLSERRQRRIMADLLDRAIADLESRSRIGGTSKDGSCPQE